MRLHSVFISLALVCPTLGAAPAFERAVEPFLKEHCLRCHDDRKQKGDFRLDTLARDFTSEETAQRWAEVVFRMSSGEMPPKEEPQPGTAALGEVIPWITQRIEEGRAVRMARRSTVSMYRLSRDEYAYTVLDLLGVTYDVTQPGAFNEEPRWHGYDRIGSQLSLSPSHVERYVKAADSILDRALSPAEAAPKTFKADAVLLKHPQQRAKLEALGIADKVRAQIWPGGSVPGLRGWGGLKEPGRYRARVRLAGLKGLDGRVPHLSVWSPSLKRSVFDEDILATEEEPATVEFEVFLQMPTELDLRNEVPEVFARDGNHTLNVLNSNSGVFMGSREVQRLNPTGYKLTDDRGNAIYPLLIVESVEWEGPLPSKEGYLSRGSLLPAPDASEAEIRARLQTFAARAWRRPVALEELSPYLRLLEAEKSAGEKFAGAYKTALAGILSSKNFYYLSEGAPKENRQRLDAFELAARLSYFLWSSLPDAALQQAAGSGKLLEKAELKHQLLRMLGDAKAQRFTQSFPAQWLQLHRVGMFPPDPKLYPDYDRWLEQSMKREPVEFFAECLSKNLPVREFLDSNWSTINKRLALHYGVPPPTESGFQRVLFSEDSRRGGLLTQAGVLMLTSDGTRHRPVHRGVWLSETVFGRTPPAPPPNVEPIEPVPKHKPKQSVRQQLEAHATQASCKACHQRIDPLGLAFDNYDAIGRWRTEERVVGGQGADPTVNASGVLWDGRSFDGPASFKQLLCADVDRFALALTEHLATYALRRVMTVDDAWHLRAVVQAAQPGGYRLGDLLEALVLSELFEQR